MDVILPLHTERLLLRDFVQSDWRAVHAYGSDLAVVPYLPWGPNTEQDSRDFVEKMLAQQSEPERHQFDLAVVIKASGQLMGGCGLRLPQSTSQDGVIGYCLNRQAWGQGYAPEAARALLTLGFGQLRLHRITAECDVENRASARVLEKIGMRYEGHLREHMWYKGAWHDTLLYAILDHEWQSEK